MEINVCVPLCKVYVKNALTRRVVVEFYTIGENRVVNRHYPHVSR